MPASYGSIQYGPYLELEEVKQWLQFSAPDLASVSDFALTKLIGMACSNVQRFCNRPFGRHLYEPPYGRFDGGSGINSTYIVLPQSPVIEVVSVVEYQGNNPVALTEIDPSTGGDGYIVNYQKGILTRVLGGVWERPWFPSSQGVLVTWWAGIWPLPDDLWTATVELVAYWFRNVQQRSGFQAGGTFDAEFDPASNASGLWAGVPNRIIALIEPYRLPVVA